MKLRLYIHFYFAHFVNLNYQPPLLCVFKQLCNNLKAQWLYKSWSGYCCAYINSLNGHINLGGSRCVIGFWEWRTTKLGALTSDRATVWTQFWVCLFSINSVIKHLILYFIPSICVCWIYKFAAFSCKNICFDEGDILLSESLNLKLFKTLSNMFLSHGVSIC